MKKTILALSAIVLSIGCKAQNGNDFDQVKQQHVETLLSHYFGLDRLMNDIHISGSDLYVSFEMDKDGWQKCHDRFKDMFGSREVIAMIPYATPENSQKVASKIRELIKPDSCVIYMIKGNDAVKWNNIAKSSQGLGKLLTDKKLVIHTTITAYDSGENLATYTISSNDLNTMERVKEKEGNAAATFYITTYSAIAGMMGTNAAVPFAVDGSTIATGVDKDGYLITFNYIVDDDILDIPGIDEMQKAIITAQTELKNTRMLKYTGYKTRYVYRGKNNRSKEISFTIE